MRRMEGDIPGTWRDGRRRKKVVVLRRLEGRIEARRSKRKDFEKFTGEKWEESLNLKVQSSDFEKIGKKN